MIDGARNQVPFHEKDRVDWPISPYAATKLAAEKLCYTYSHLYGIRAVCLRLIIDFRGEGNGQGERCGGP